MQSGSSRGAGVRVDSHSSTHTIGPFTALASAWIAGTLAVSSWSSPAGWTICAACSLAAMIVMLALHRLRGGRVWGVIAAGFIAAAWTAVWTGRVPADHVSRIIGDRSLLVRATGRVDGTPFLSTAKRGAFGAFSYKPPATLFLLDLDTLDSGDGPRTSSGVLLAKIAQADHRLAAGDRLIVTGWLSGVDGPANPGEADYRDIFAYRGIDARLTLDNRDNWTLLARATDGWWVRTRRAASDAASASLRLAMPHDPQRLAFLDIILLGRHSGDLSELDNSFRRVGLAHILSISGAHLAILAMIVWCVARLVVRHPPRAAMAVLVVLLVYLIALPAEVPIIRAGVMAVMFCLGQMSGRRVAAIELVALSAIIVLIWRPADLYSPGFQLSFGVTAALILFTTRVSEWILPPALADDLTDRTGSMLKRWAANLLAANTVGFAVSLPAVAYHFEMISPLSIFLSILAMLPIGAVLLVGYLKILAGLALPSLGVVLAGPLAWVSDVLTGLVTHASGWPGVSVSLREAPSAVWAAAMTGVVIAIFAGAFAGRRVAAGASLCIGAVWLFVPLQSVLPAAPSAPPSAMTVNMFAVGDGSCYLVRLHAKPPGTQASRGDADYTLMFDCGSAEYLDVTPNSIAPALRKLGVKRIDTLIVSHADLDHFCGVLDLMDRVSIGRTLLSPQMQAEAASLPNGAVAHLIEGIGERGVPIQTVSRGWFEQHAGGRLDMLWPPADKSAPRANDVALVLSIRAADRRVLLDADIQQDAITGLLASGDDFHADVCDLPHHGSFVDASPAWLAAVSPSIVLQSSGPERLRHDRWANLLAQRRIERFVTARLGMVEMRIAEGRPIEISSFKPR